MTDSIDDRLRESLAALSKPVETGEEPSLVHRALAEVESGQSRTHAHGPSDAPRKPWHRRIPGGLTSLVVASLALVVTIGVIAPAFQTAQAPVARGIKADGRPSREQIAEQELRADHTEENTSFAAGNTSAEPGVRFKAGAAAPAAPVPMAAKSAAAEAVADSAATQPAEQRIILRTGSCEIRVDDVEVARHTVESLIRPDLGEYIENASVALDQSSPIATITVRIDSARFDEFLAALSGVGTVRSVSVNAADATDQIVDLEARIRNERRVEEEVLRLLENRQDAPLEDIVRVRRELSDVRGSIERMEAQRQSILGRAELSTVRITLVGPEPTFSPVDRDAPTFGERMRDALADGWRTCTDSVVWVAGVIVAGLVWWIAAAVIIWLAVRHHRWTSSWR